ncbi:MAG: flagellar hook-length control protein FliK [Ilumatobacteraceae bacterium]
MSNVAAPSTVVPAAAPGPSGSGTRNLSTGTGGTRNDRFDRHLDQAVRADRSRHTDHEVEQPSADPPAPDSSASVATEKASNSDVAARDDSRTGTDAPPAVGLVAVLLVATPKAVDLDGAPTASADVTAPAEPVVAHPVVAHPVVAEPVVAEPVVAEPVAGSPAATVLPMPADTEASTATPLSDLPDVPATTDDPLAGVQIEVDAPVAAPVIATVGRASLRARAAADALTDDASLTAAAGATAAADADTTDAASPSPMQSTVDGADGAVPANTVLGAAAARRTSFAHVADVVPAEQATPGADSTKAEVRAPLSLPGISVDLSDEGLGPMRLQAHQGSDGLHLTITAADREVGAALARAGAELRRDLEAAGTAVSSLDIGHGRTGADAQGQGRHPADGALRRPPAAMSIDGLAAANTGRRAPLATAAARTSPADAGLDLLI